MIQQNWNQDLIEISALPSSLQHYSQQPRYGNSLTVHQWMKKMWCIYTMQYYSARRKKENLLVCDNMDGPWEHYAKWNKLEKDKYSQNSMSVGSASADSTNPSSKIVLPRIFNEYVLCARLCCHLYCCIYLICSRRVGQVASALWISCSSSVKTGNEFDLAALLNVYNKNNDNSNNDCVYWALPLSYVFYMHCLF